MTQSITDLQYEYDVLVNRVYNELANKATTPAPEGILRFNIQKYYDIAHNYHTYLIAALQGKDYPAFPVNLSDLSLKSKQKLNALPTFQLQRVLKDVVLHIFKDIDDEYNSVFEKGNHVNLTKEIAKILKVELI